MTHASASRDGASAGTAAADAAPAGTGPAPLGLLLAEVLRTRAHHGLVLQRSRTGSPEVRGTRQAALRALEHYVSALRSRDLPVPPRLRRDLTMLRLLCDDAGPHRPL